MSLSLDGRFLAIACPRRCSRATIAAFVKDRREWLSLQIRHSVDINPPRDDRNRPQLLLNGKKYALCRATPQSGKEKVSLHSEAMALAGGDRAEWAENITRFYRSMTLRFVERELPRLADAVGVGFSSVVVADYRSQWGSCRPDGSGSYRLAFNSGLAMMPPWVRTYVMVHELCHCRIFDHSPRFWSAVERYYFAIQSRPHQMAIGWLNRHNAVLRVKFEDFVLTLA